MRKNWKKNLRQIRKKIGGKNWEKMEKKYINKEKNMNYFFKKKMKKCKKNYEKTLEKK